MKIKFFSFFIFLLIGAVFIYSATLVSDASELYVFKKIMAILIPISLVPLINIWTGYPYIDLGKRFLTAIIVFFICFAVSCSSTKRERKKDSDIIIQKSRFYIGYAGDQGALGNSGTAVFQEKELVGSIYRVKEICYFDTDKDKVVFTLLSPNQLECKSDKNRYIIEVHP